tara:strand:+ start:1795 stop:2394 length:600 start_codon:yes stop_codon:yes gene_type:complete
MKQLNRIYILSILLFGNTIFSQESFSSENISNAAIELTKDEVIYDGSYYSIPYPNGDVPDGIGVCTDVIIRTYRSLGFDLQKEIHEDMNNNFDLYPKIWGLKKPDKNIDHRRVPNQMTYFKRQGSSLTISNDSKNYLPGDIVAWDLGGGTTHIGIVVNKKSQFSDSYMIVHNIGAGQNIDDCLFDFKIIGHYRFLRNIN